MEERYFTDADCAHFSGKVESGFYLTANQQPYVRSRLSGATADGTPLWWIPSVASRQGGVDLRNLADVQSVTIASKGSSAAELDIAVGFANHLSDHRAKHRGVRMPCVISSAQPHAPIGCVRIPHLMAYIVNNAVQDRAMWEILPEPEAERWLGGSLPDQEAIEKQLARLLRPRRTFREGEPINNPAYQELTGLLAHGRYLSILFVYQHIDLFNELFKAGF
jgi:hypothetical protein